MIEVTVFDVNETLLDLSVLRPHFDDMFGDPDVMQQWFGQLLRLSLVATVTAHYQPFDQLAGDALNMVARQREANIDDDQRAALRNQMLNLPPHDDVRPALERLQQAGRRIAALTNSARPALEQQLSNAGIADLFERTFSVDEVQLFKPAAAVYRYAARELRVEPGQMIMVAAHDWDVTGAIRAGCQGAFVARPGKVLADSGERPHFIGSTLGSVVDQLLQAD